MSDIDTYRLQLQQVEAALTSDPENSELITLKEDLIQVIELTKDLLESAISTNVQTARKPQVTKRKNETDIANIRWNVGQRCQAIWPADNTYHEAIVNDVNLDERSVCVTFEDIANVAPRLTTSIDAIKPPTSNMSKAMTASRRALQAKKREYDKKRKAKKTERLQVLDQQREMEKQKWTSFSSKAFGKKGFVRKSIFKTPETACGRVGIGTCGVSGMKMTNFAPGIKHRKGT